MIQCERSKPRFGWLYIFTLDPQSKVAGVHLAAAPPGWLTRRFLLQEGRVRHWERDVVRGVMREGRRGFPSDSAR